MKEPIVGIGTCGCRHCRLGQIRFDKKQRNKARRRHQRIEIRYLKTIINEAEEYAFRMPSYSKYTD